MEGKIKAVKDKGFGFIARSDGGSEVFFHHSAVQGPGGFDQLKAGDAVTFDIDNENQGAKKKGRGPRAINVRKV